MNAVEEVLVDLGAAGIPRIVALNKVDAVSEDQLLYLERSCPGALQTSALDGLGIPELLEAITAMVGESSTVILHVPAGRGEVLSGLYRDGVVLNRDIEGETIVVTVKLPPERIDRYIGFKLRQRNGADD